MQLHFKFCFQKLETLQNELLETRSKFEEDRTAKNEEMELIIADLDRANHRAEASTKEAEELRNTLLQKSDKSNLQNDNEKDQSSIISGLEAELSRKDREISQLSSDLSSTEDKNSIEISQIQRQLTGKNYDTDGYKMESYICDLVPRDR